jgi:hypothetical protein
MTNRPFRPDPATSRRAQRGAALPWVFFGFLLVAGFFFFTEHRAHLMGALPFILLALCPLMHLFHAGHGGHGHQGGHRGPDTPKPTVGGQGSTPAPPGAPRPPHQH